MKPGVYYGLPNADYHGGAGVSKSFLDVVAKSPLHAKALLDQANDNDREPSPQQQLGTAFHALLLEPEAFANEYVCELTQADAPDAIADRQVLVDMVDALNETRLAKLPTGGTKDELVARILAAYEEQPGTAEPYGACSLSGLKIAALKAEIERLNAERDGKLPTSGDMQALAGILAANGQPVTLWQDVRSRWRAENEGFTVLSVETYHKLIAMCAAVNAHPYANALLRGCEGVAEASIYVDDPATGELRRIRPDWWRKDGILVDVKTTRDASPEGFAKSLAEYRYHVQHPYYLDTAQAAFDAGMFPEGWERPKAFVFLAVESAAPYATAVYMLDADSEQLGRIAANDNLATLAECRRTGVWPGYGDALQAIGVPEWYLRRHAHQLGAA